MTKMHIIITKATIFIITVYRRFSDFWLEEVEKFKGCLKEVENF